jgi:leucyl aminopeptidase
MAEALTPGFENFPSAPKGVLILLAEEGLKIGPASRRVLAPAGDLLQRAAAGERFTGKSGTALDIVAPSGLAASRLIVVGVGKPAKFRSWDFVKLGGAALGRVSGSATDITLFAELAGAALKPEHAADIAHGARLRAYRFDLYKTKRKEGEDEPAAQKLTVAVANAAAARKAWGPRQALAEGAVLARDLVNEPPNILFPAEFARRAGALKKLGVSVEVLDVAAMKKLGMNSLLAVGQGSAHDSRMVVMRWNGGKKGAAPVAFIGKGVCFDTGGISIKPASGMEDMKGDMAGAACVVGLMHALAARKAKVNAVGAIGLVENMPDGNSYRPGDIVKTMSGQTIEIINTDAEGRLVLADVLHYVNTKYEPKFMVNLATLTGAIIVALGQEYAGMFSNDDRLSERLTRAGQATGERVWRMPLGPEYDKMIDSKFADMKNTGGRYGGSITASVRRIPAGGVRRRRARGGRFDRSRVRSCRRKAAARRVLPAPARSRPFPLRIAAARWTRKASAGAASRPRD